MDKEIIENNKMIAKFMGWTYIPWQEATGKHVGWINPKFKIHSPKIDNTYLCRSHNDLKYHKDWNWLMRVMEKIENLNRFTDIQHGLQPQNFGLKKYAAIIGDVVVEDNIKINAVYNAVIEFIKLYDQQK